MKRYIFIMLALLLAFQGSAFAQCVLEESTAVSVLIGPFLDSSDGNTEETALTISQADILLSKNGGDLAQQNYSGGAAHNQNGFYTVNLDTTDTNTTGNLTIFVHESGALYVKEKCLVVGTNTYDSLFSNTYYQNVNVAQISGDSTSADNLELDYDGTGYNKSNSTMGTVTTLTGHTAQTGDNYARLGAPAGASIAADIAENQTDLNNIISSLSTVDGNVDAILVDTNELQTDWTNGGRLDLLVDGIISSITTIDGNVDSILDDTGTSGVILASTTITTLFKEDISGSFPNNSVAKYIRTIFEALGSDLGTAQAGASTTITLEAGSNSNNDFYNDRFIVITGGTGAGQARLIHDYVGSTLVATVDKAWTTTPDATTAYSIAGYGFVHSELQSIVDGIITSNDFDKSSAFALASADSGSTQIARVGADGDTLETLSDQLDVVDSNIDTLTTGVNVTQISGDTSSADLLELSCNTIVSGAATATTLSTSQMSTDLTEATDDHYNGRIVIWNTGNLTGQVAGIDDYDGTTKTITFDVTLTEAPSAGDTFTIH